MRFAILLFSVLLSAPGLILAQADGEGLTAEEIMERSHHRVLYQGDSKRARVEMTITDANGNERRRQFYSLRLDKDSPEKAADRGRGEQFYYIYFRRPGDIKKTVFLVHKHPDGDDDRWLYLPGLDLVKRIAAGDKRTSFVGSNLFYEDVSGRDLYADSHQLESADDTYFVLKSTPKDPGEVEFSYYRTWIHKASFIPVRIEYFDKNGEKYRECENQKVEQINGKPTVVKGLMRDLKRGEQTLVESSRVEYDADLPEEIFSERYLRNAPDGYFP
jgi:hypothetical protein